MTDYSSKAHFGNYNPASFGWGGAHDPMAHPELLVPFRYGGGYWGLMHRAVVPVFKALFKELIPHIEGGVTTKQDEGCYNPGSVTVGGSRSFHTFAIATDTNWSDNAMYSSHSTGPRVLPPATSEIARRYGCEWGGDWSYPQDWMHIEVHLSPTDAVRVGSLPSRVTHQVKAALGFKAKYPLARTRREVFGPITSKNPKVLGGKTAWQRTWVRLIQARLVYLGYVHDVRSYTREAKAWCDGEWGPETTAAVVKWQKRQGIQPVATINWKHYGILMSQKAKRAA